MIRGLPRDPLLAAIVQAVEQQKLQEQQKAQVMQSLGFGGNMSQFGAIPQGHGITQMDGKVYTRPGGTPPEIQQLLESLTGANAQPYARFSGYTDNFPTKSLQTQANSPMAGGTEGLDPMKLQTAANMHKQAQSLDDIQQLYYLYPKEMEYLLGGGNK